MSARVVILSDDDGEIRVSRVTGRRSGRHEPAPRLPSAPRRSRSWLADCRGAVIVASAAAFFWYSRPPPARSPNVLLITIDTLRADRVGVYDPRQRETTPAIDALAGRGVVFEHAQTRGAADRTLARHDPHRSLPARARRAQQRHLLAGRQRDDAGRTSQDQRLPDGGVRRRLSRRRRLRLRSGVRLVRRRAFIESGDADLGAERPANEVADKAAAWLRSRHDAPVLRVGALLRSARAVLAARAVPVAVRRPCLRRRGRLRRRTDRRVCSRPCDAAGTSRSTRS